MRFVILALLLLFARPVYAQGFSSGFSPGFSAPQAAYDAGKELLTALHGVEAYQNRSDHDQGRMQELMDLSNIAVASTFHAEDLSRDHDPGAGAAIDDAHAAIDNLERATPHE